ncbi:hypothetical protein [Acidithiobacillus sp.]
MRPSGSFRVPISWFKGDETPALAKARSHSRWSPISGAQGERQLGENGAVGIVWRLMVGMRAS